MIIQAHKRIYFCTLKCNERKRKVILGHGLVPEVFQEVEEEEDHIQDRVHVR
jgi:hypothetical protein